MPDVHHGGINARGNVSIGGDVDMHVETQVATPAHQQPAEARPVSDDLRERVEDLLDALDAAGLTRRPPLAQVAIDLRSEVDGTNTRPARIEQLLAAIESHAVQIATIAAAITAIRLALSR